ncbi:uncharacterized protein LOC107830174 [Nicotiana tabacum]|uniref:UPF0664 stress-induced protein C29B12.11c n=1 Tax=Nicotiana tabacum TaxID=4097 RepID=A0A1S4DIM9_TOBAC|nr:PREDICTED: UPF0664 stress-induced protein C29B12.11c-like [Nicotiana tabacum]
MALNPKLFPHGMPMPYLNELFVFASDVVDFEIDNIPRLGEVQAKGTIYLSNIRMVFVAKNPRDNFIAFDIPLLFVHGEKFNQPIFFCKNISGYVNPVVQAANGNTTLPHSFKILFNEGGYETFIPLVFKLIGKVRRRYRRSRAKPRVDPHEAAQTPVDEMTRHAYVDPNDPTFIYLQQPKPESKFRRCSYQSQSAEMSI